MKLNKKEKMIIILSLLGFILSVLLLIVDINLKNNISNNICNISDYINCDKIAASSYSHIGPIPISLIGIIFYLFIPIYIIFIKNHDIIEEGFKVLGILSLIAVAFSIFLFLISIIKIKALCIFCTGTYIVNIILLVLTYSYLKKSLHIFIKENLLSFIYAGVLSVLVSFIGFLLVKSIIKVNESSLIQEYNNSTIYSVNSIFSPYIGASDPKIVIVIYSDLFCPACKDLMNNIELLMKDEEIKNILRVYFKHYPIDKECNPQIGYNLHPGSCTASLIGFELMKRGLFWEYEKEIRELPIKDEENVIDVAKNFIKDKIEIKKIKEENLKYLTTNILEAKALGINATPTWFINNRKIVGAFPAEEIKKLIKYILN
ncbi:MAG TPA: vitamin K epoxide reductase family protein [Spirochaetota bacterium]|nr:vitamin K epoxide reductase family protein [Spirochaetota bacterium]HOM38068.1 vitamin K epoxide reductase family protein [Spirochaetota bacterium]HPQ48871.1 vitamin K epoxide reductase family protein [Spirochaetota bacterium]